jgi:hypothetical protein
MAAVLEQHTNDPELAQLEALERMLAVLCDEVVRLADAFRSVDPPRTREAELQLIALDERRAQALECLREREREPRQFRIGRLERLIEALNCSWTYFSARLNNATVRAAREGAVLVR